MTSGFALSSMTDDADDAGQGLQAGDISALHAQVLVRMCSSVQEVKELR